LSNLKLGGRDSMINIKKGVLLGTLLFIGLSFVNAVSAQPSVNILSVDPEEPMINSDFTVTANFSWNNITYVNLTVQPCSEELCYHGWTTTMVETNGTYSGTVKLDNEEAIYVQYYFEVVAENESYLIGYLDPWKVNLTADTDDGNNGEEPADNEDNGTPGFELLFLLTALFIVAYIIKRKR